MQTYTNRFNVAMNKDGSEIILNFFQNMPELQAVADQDATDSDLPTEMIPVANLVMTGQCAHNLLTVLQNILGKIPPQSE